MCFAKLCIFWNIALIYEFIWLCNGRNTGLGQRPSLGGLGGRSPQPEQIITDFLYFKTVSFITSDVYWIPRLSCFYEAFAIFLILTVPTSFYSRSVSYWYSLKLLRCFLHFASCFLQYIIWYILEKPDMNTSFMHFQLRHEK